MGDFNAFAVHNGVLYGWGQGDAVGDGTTTNRSLPVPVSQGAIPSGVSIVQMAVADAHTLAVGSDGKAYAWGIDPDGQLGDGESLDTDVTTPVAVAQGAIPAGVKIVKVVASSTASWALGTNGKAYAWGLGSGFLGDGSSTTQEDSPVAVARGAIPAGVKIIDIAASERVRGDDDLTANGDVVLLGNNGKAYVFGSDNTHRQLGKTNPSFTAATPVALGRGAIPAGVKLIAASAGNEGFEALGSNGKAYGWGAGGEGQLGRGSLADSSTPVAAVAGAIPAGVELIKITSLDDATVALGSNGKAYSWGFGQLGAEDTTFTRTPRPTAVSQGQIPPGVRLIAVSGDVATTAVLGDDGNVYAWGDNENDQIGSSGVGPAADVPARVALPGIDSRTTLTVGGTLASGKQVTLTAKVIPTDEAGVMTFTDGSTVLGEIAVHSGFGSTVGLTTALVKAGAQRFTATFVPTDTTGFTGSKASVSVVVKSILKRATPRIQGAARSARDSPPSREGGHPARSSPSSGAPTARTSLERPPRPSS